MWPRRLSGLVLAAAFSSVSLAQVTAQPSHPPSPAAASSELRSRISSAMLAGDCQVAKELAIGAGEFDLAEQVVRLCTPKSGKPDEKTISVPNSAVVESSADQLRRATTLFVQKQYSSAYELYLRLSSAGDAEAANQIGVMLQSGIGLEKDQRKAIQFYQLAADRGSVLGNYNFGVVNLKAVGTPVNYPEALKRFTYAANKGNAESQNYLGVMYAHGYGVRKDLPEALRLYKLAAANGSGFAKQNISSLIDIGAATETDLVIPISGNHEPNWKRTPSIEQLAAFYPKEAVVKRATGHATVHCEVDEIGQIGQCTIVSEDPPGLGFGNAALKLARISEFSPKLVNGTPTKGVLNIPFNFEIPPSMFDKLIRALSASK
jgi:TonB family protein